MEVNLALFTNVAIYLSVFGEDTAPNSRGIRSSFLILVAAVFFIMMFLPVLPAAEFAVLVLAVFLREASTQTPEQVTITENGLLLESRHTRQDYQWTGITKIHRTRNRLFIYLLPKIACVVPRRAFPGEKDWNDFSELCFRYKNAVGPVAQNPVSVAAVHSQTTSLEQRPLDK